MAEVIVLVGQSQESRASTNRGRIRCYKCREYDQFTERLSYNKRRKRDRSNTADV